MKELILNNQLLTMSSRDLLDIVNQARLAHSEPPVRLNVFNERIKDELDGEDYKIFVVTNPNGTKSEECQLTLDQCVLVGMRESKAVRRNVLAKLKELENQQPKLPQTYIEALECLLESEKQKLALQIELHTAQPKINHYDKVVERHTLITATQVGQKLGMSAQKLNVILEGFKVYNMAVKRGRAFAQWFIDGGLGEMKQTDGGFSQPLFTTKGEAWVVEQLISKGMAS